MGQVAVGPFKAPRKALFQTSSRDPQNGGGSLQTAGNSSGESNIFLGSGREGTESNPQQEKCEELQKINTGRVHLRLQAPKK